MQSVKCAFVATVKNAEILRTKGGAEYLSIEAMGGVDGEDRFWVTTFSKSAIAELIEKLKPDSKIYVEGTEKLRLALDGKPFRAVSASLITALFEIEARPKPPAAAAQRKEKAKRDDNIMLDGRSATYGGKKAYDHEFNDDVPF
jgi:hypothetical protein